MDVADSVIQNAGIFVQTTLSILETMMIMMNESKREKEFVDNLGILKEYAEAQEKLGNVDSPIYSYATNDFTRNELYNSNTLKSIPMTVMDGKKDDHIIVMIRDCDKETFIKGILELAQEKLRLTRLSPEDFVKLANQQNQKIIKIDNLDDVQIEHITGLSKKDNAQFQFTVIKDDVTGKSSIYAMEKDAYNVEYAYLNTMLKGRSLAGYTMGEISLKAKNDVLNNIRDGAKKNKKMYIVSGTNPAHRIEIDSRSVDTDAGKKIFGNFVVYQTKNTKNGPSNIHVGYSELDFASITSSSHEATNKYNEELEFQLSTMEQPILLSEEEYKGLDIFSSAYPDVIDMKKASPIFEEIARKTYVQEFQNEDDKITAHKQDKLIMSIDKEFSNIVNNRAESNNIIYEKNIVEEFRNGNYDNVIEQKKNNKQEITTQDKKFLDELRNDFPLVAYQTIDIDKSPLAEFASIDDTIEKYGDDGFDRNYATGRESRDNNRY